MAELFDDNEQIKKDLYRKMLAEDATAESTRKYSFPKFKERLSGDEVLLGKVADIAVKKGWSSNKDDFYGTYFPELTAQAPPTPKPKPVPAPAQQFPVGIAAPESIKGAAPSVTDIGREMAFKPAVQQPIEPVEPVEPIGVMAPEAAQKPIPSVTEVAREMAFKPPVQPKMPKEEEERGFGEWAGDLTGTILEGGKRITKNLLGAVGYFAQTQAATDPMFSLPYEKRQQMMQGAGQTMYNVAEKAQKDFQAEVAKRNIQTDVLQAIENKQYKDVPEAALYTVGDAAMQIIPSILTMGGSSFMQTLPTAYRDGVESIAKEKGISPEQVIASGDDAIITATITSGIVGALDKFGADRIGGFISNKAGYKAVRDWLLKQNINKTLAKGAQLLGAGIGESGTEYLQEGVGQAGIIAAKSPTMAAFFEKLPDELFTAQAERQRRGAAVGGLIGGTGVAGAGRALTSVLSSQKAPGLNKFSDNVVNNEIIQNAARDYQDNIAKAEQQGRKPDSFNQKQLNKIAENPEAWVRDEIKYIQQTIESNKTLGLDSKVEENSLAKATSLLNQIKAEKKGMEQADIAPAQEAVPVVPEAEVIAPEGGAPMPQKVKILGKDVNMYNDYIPSRPEDVEPDAMYIFNADSIDGIPPLLQDVAYANKRESNGVKTENWHASISGEDLLNLYPQKAASPNLIAAPEAAPVTEEVPFEEVPAETEDELAFLDEMRLTPEEDAARLAQEGIIPAAPVAPAEEVTPEVVPEVAATQTREDIIKSNEKARQEYKKQRTEKREERLAKKQHLIDIGLSEGEATEVLRREIQDEEDAFESSLPKVPGLPKSQFEVDTEKNEADFKKMLQQTGAKETNKAWGITNLGDSFGYEIGNKNGAIYIKPYEEEIDTEEGRENVVTGTAIELVYVPPTQRGKGKAKKLIQQVVDAADKTGTTLKIEAVPQGEEVDAAGLKKLYESFGFVFDDIYGTRAPQAAPVAQAEEVAPAAPAPKGRKKAAPVTPIALPKELLGKTTISSTGFGGDREHTTGKVSLEDLKVLDVGIETARQTLETDKSFKPSREPIVVGVDVNTGEKQLLDGYHRYLLKSGKGEVPAKFIPMKNGEIISFEEAKAAPVTPAPVAPKKEEGKKAEPKKEEVGIKEKTITFAADEKSRIQSERTGDRGGRYSSRGLAPLEGAPAKQGFHGPDARLVEVAEKYARENGIPLVRQSEYVEVDANRAKRIAQAYEEMKHNPQNPAVKEAYQNLIKQTIGQYKALRDAGYKFYFIDLSTPEGQEYASNPWNALRDIRENKRMGVFSTEEGFGSNEDFNPEANPLLEETEFKWSFGEKGPLRRVLANDLFRAVHDAFGHGLEGAGFRARGEENAWQAHIKLFTGSAQGAITTETRGQNSWLNFGPFGEKNRTAKVEDTEFADQKTGLMPEWTWTEGRANDMPSVPSFTSSQSSEAATAFDKAKTSNGFDKKHGKGAYKALSDITKNFEDIMDGMSGKIKQDCL